MTNEDLTPVIDFSTHAVPLDYWWRTVGWYMRSDSVGIFALKTDGDSLARYGSDLDKRSWLPPMPRSLRSGVEKREADNRASTESPKEKAGVQRTRIMTVGQLETSGIHPEDMVLVSGKYYAATANGQAIIVQAKDSKKLPDIADPETRLSVTFVKLSAAGE